MEGKLTKEQQEFYDECYRIFYENFDKKSKLCKKDGLAIIDEAKYWIEKKNRLKCKNK